MRGKRRGRKGGEQTERMVDERETETDITKDHRINYLLVIL